MAGLLAAFPAGWVTSKKGRKKSMVVSGAFYIVGAILLAAAHHIAMLYIGRVLLGIGVGFAIQCTTCATLSPAMPGSCSRFRSSVQENRQMKIHTRAHAHAHAHTHTLMLTQVYLRSRRCIHVLLIKHGLINRMTRHGRCKLLS